MAKCLTDNKIKKGGNIIRYSNMSIDEDFVLALRLQEQFENEVQTKMINPSHPKKVMNTNDNAIECYKKPAGKEMSLVDPTWEYIDPTPDIHALFIQFDNRFFWGKLKHVEVRWSPRMTSCAGVCCYEGRGGLCSVRLSVPLLKLRPRKDLVETLLVYHSFHDEVKLYQQHWWRCNGPCQKRPPYFGMVKRSMNRAPGPSDFWWKDHEATCGGSYIKVREPPGFSDNAKKRNNKGSQETATKKTSDIRKFLDGNNGTPVKGNKINNVVGFSDLYTPNTNTEKVRNGNQNPGKEPVFPANANKINNVVGFSDLSASGKAKDKNKNIPPSKGNVLGSQDNSDPTVKKTKKPKDPNVTPHKPSNVKGKPKTNGNSSGTSFKSPVNNGTNAGPFSGKSVNKVGGMGGMLSNKGSGTFVIRAKGGVKDEEKPSIKNGEQNNFVPFSGAGHKLGTSKTSGMQSHESPILNKDYSKNKNYAIFNRNNSPEKCKSPILKVSSPEKGTFLKRHSSDSTSDVDKKRSKNDSFVDLTTDSESAIEKVNCPVCSQKVSECEINQHLDVCINSTASGDPYIKSPSCKNEVSEFEIDAHLNTCQASSSNILESDSSKVKCPACSVDISKSELNGHLDVCLGSIFGNGVNEEKEEIQGSPEESDDGKYPCPCCNQFFEDSKMNSHLDRCLAGVWDEFPSST
ncbi:hypothetical protein C0J52_06930 [Blattella germanica]|nr:hypothetical protein C0J52_06930 [Blattella germanica]